MSDDEMDHNAPELFLFLASTAHDMKNSVSVLSGTLETLLGDAATKEAAAYPQIAHMLYETKRLNNNLIQLLALYKDVGKPSYPFDSQQIEIDLFVADVMAQNRVLLKSKGVAIETDYDPELAWCFDEDLILGVVSHAINNAVNYTKDKIRLSFAETETGLEVRVEDNGRGFPPAMIEAGAAAMNGIGQGVSFSTGSTGLGLYFSSEVAKMHKHRERRGGIRLENGGTLGGGCFVLYLP